MLDNFLETVGPGVMKVLLLDRGFINGAQIGRLGERVSRARLVRGLEFGHLAVELGLIFVFDRIRLLPRDFAGFNQLTSEERERCDAIV